MGANREIKTTLKLEGEQKFKSAMRDAASAIKVLNSEQKLAKAQFEATGDKEQYMADKADILRRKIEEQQKAVKAAEDAVKKLAENGVKPTDKAMQDWTVKLNNAKSYLTTLQGQLNATESELSQQSDAMTEAANAADDYNAELQNIGKGINFQNVTQILDSMNQRLDKALQTIKNISIAIYDAVTDAGKWADDIATEASKAGIDVETYQSWMYASQFIDTEVSDIISSRQRLLKAMTSDNKETIKLFNKLGVVVRNTNGDLRDQTDVFWDVIDALGRVEDPTMRDYYAQELLGKSARELNPLIEAGSQAYKDLAEEGREVAVVSGENVENLGKLNDAQNRLNSRLEKTKTTMLASISPAFTEVTEKISGFIDEFNRFLETDEGKATLEGLNGALTALFDTLVGEVDPKTIIENVTGAIRTLTDVLKWIEEHGWAIVAVLAGMKGVMMTMTVAKAALEFLQLIKSIQWMSVSKGAGDLGKAMTGGSSGTGGAGAGKAASGGGILSALKGLWKNVYPAAIGAAYTATLTAPVWGTQLAEQRDFGGFMQERSKYDETLGVDTENASILRMQRIYKTLADMAETGDALTEDDVKKIIAFRQELKELTGSDYGSGMDEFIDYYKDNGLDAMTEYDFEKVLGQMIADLGSTIRESSASIPDGMAAGINDNAAVVTDAAQGVADDVVQTIEDAWAVGSPSKVMMYYGEMAAQGLANGIEAGAAAAIAAAERLAAAVNAAMGGAQVGGIVSSGYGMSRAFSGTPYYGGGSGAGTVNVTMVMDKQVVGRAVAPVVDATLGANVAMTR